MSIIKILKKFDVVTTPQILETLSINKDNNSKCIYELKQYINKDVFKNILNYYIDKSYKPFEQLILEEEVTFTPDIINLIKICNQKKKNNILLIGDAGSGKTTLAKYISTNIFPLYNVNISHVLSNTQYRGEFEKKLLNIMDVSQNESKAIFFDEIHTILSTMSEGGISGENVLKPLIERSSIQIIGATTIKEFELIKQDPAFVRRFNIIHLSEKNNAKKYKEFSSKINTKEYNVEEVYHICELIKTEYKISFMDVITDFLDFQNSLEPLENFKKIYGIEHD